MVMVMVVLVEVLVVWVVFAARMNGIRDDYMRRYGNLLRYSTKCHRIYLELQNPAYNGKTIIFSNFTSLLLPSPLAQNPVHIASSSISQCAAARLGVSAAVCWKRF